MAGRARSLHLGFAAMLAAALAGTVAAAPSTSAVIASIDLSGPFEARSTWRLVATQGPSIEDPMGSGDRVPDAVHLCLSRKGAAQCDPGLRDALRPASKDDLFAEPHYLDKARVLFAHDKAGPALLLVQTASLHSGDGDQVVSVQVLSYRRDADRFVRVYEHVTGRNNNQEVRCIESGPLRGDIVSVEPTGDAPFGFWVSVEALTPTHAYRQVLRYRSATRYGDGNRLAVIDSEMPNIQRRLGVWRAGPPPLLAGRCPKPRLTRMELWCD